MPTTKHIVIMGAAGRDFHNFNVVYRNDPNVRVVAFTAAQISGIANRVYPQALAGPYYPDGIPIVAENELETICSARQIDQVVFAYSDLQHVEVMHRASRALACGADFVLLGPHSTMLKSSLPVIAISAVRTGCGKSQTARWLSRLLKNQGLQVAVVRHPMPYGDLQQQAVQCFASLADLDAADCTLEEREEYEPHLNCGNTVYAGVDYARILEMAERQADIILWDGGNNDFPFYRPDLHIALVDPLRLGDESAYHPGEAVLRMADVVVMAKSDVATAEARELTETSVRRINPRALLIQGTSPITLESERNLRDTRVLVVEDGPTTTHGGMPYGAGYIAAQRAGATVVDPRPYATPQIAAVYDAYPHIGPILPAMGYSHEQLESLQSTIQQADVDTVISGTPIDLAARLNCGKPVIRVRYEFAEAGTSDFTGIITRFLTQLRR